MVTSTTPPAEPPPISPSPALTTVRPRTEPTSSETSPLPQTTTASRSQLPTPTPTSLPTFPPSVTSSTRPATALLWTLTMLPSLANSTVALSSPTSDSSDLSSQISPTLTSLKSLSKLSPLNLFINIFPSSSSSSAAGMNFEKAY